MPYYRFENMEQICTNPHLSTGTGAVVDGQYITLRNNNKATGTGSQLHYHPNELLIFLIAGKLNAVVGKDQRVVHPERSFMSRPMLVTKCGPPKMVRSVICIARTTPGR